MCIRTTKYLIYFHSLDFFLNLLITFIPSIAVSPHYQTWEVFCLFQATLVITLLWLKCFLPPAFPQAMFIFSLPLGCVFPNVLDCFLLTCSQRLEVAYKTPYFFIFLFWFFFIGRIIHDVNLYLLHLKNHWLKNTMSL